MNGTSTRRRVIRAVGVAATASLAGCSSSNDESDGTTTRTTSGGTFSRATGGTLSGSATTDGTSSAGPTSTEGTTEADETSGTTRGTSSPPKRGAVRFSTQAGTTVRGTLLGEGSCGVVFVHGVGFDRKDWRPQMEDVAAEGYTALSVDLNLDDRSTTPDYLLAAVRYLRQRVGVDDVVLFGASAGANAVARANAQAEPATIDGNLVLSAGKSAGAGTELQGWSLFVVSRNDADRFVRTTRRMYENAPGQKRFQKLSGSAHGQKVFEDSTAGDEVMNVLFDLLATACGGES